VLSRGVYPVRSFGGRFNTHIGSSAGWCYLHHRAWSEAFQANDLDRARDIDRRRHVIRVAGKPRRVTPTFWRLFALLYAHRNEVVDYGRLLAELYPDGELPIVANSLRANVRRLRKALAGSRYSIVTPPTIGCELIVAISPARGRHRRRHSSSELSRGA
jgi:DNA-binding response OmpR family regulator